MFFLHISGISSLAICIQWLLTLLLEESAYIFFTVPLIHTYTRWYPWVFFFSRLNNPSFRTQPSTVGQIHQDFNNIFIPLLCSVSMSLLRSQEPDIKIKTFLDKTFQIKWNVLLNQFSVLPLSKKSNYWYYAVRSSWMEKKIFKRKKERTDLSEENEVNKLVIIYVFSKCRINFTRSERSWQKVSIYVPLPVQYHCEFTTFLHAVSV